MNNNSDSKEELRQKLKHKLNQLKEANNKPSIQTKNKLEKDAKKEKKEVDNDPRVTQSMKNLFIQALQSSPGIDLDNPCEILNNKEQSTIDYYNYCIKLMKNNNNNPEILNNPYCKYMKEVLGLN